MKNIIDYIDDQLYYDEICLSEDHGCALYAPGPGFGRGRPKEEIILKAEKSGIKFFPDLVDFYTQVEYVHLNWQIFDDKNDPKGGDSSLQFKNDKWLRENYLDGEYSWPAVKLLLSGRLNVATLEQVIALETFKHIGLYQAAEFVGCEAGSLRPIDFNEYAVACVKLEKGVLKDNIYLYTGFGGMPDKLYDMSVTFEQYLELAYKAKCFNYWNLVYCERENTKHYELMKRFWPKLFPHLTPDLEEFGIRY